MASELAKALKKQRNARIKTEFWAEYKKLEGRHYARIEIVAALLSKKYFLTPHWIKQIAGKYE